MGVKYATNFGDETVLLILPIEYPVDSDDMEFGFSTISQDECNSFHWFHIVME